MDKISYEEIVSILAKHGRPDLIAELKLLESKIVDKDYSPTEKEKRDYRRKERLSVSEGSSAEDEDIEIKDEGGGFYSLK